MDVSYSDKVTNTVKDLRERVYNTNKFKDIFTKNIESIISATNISFIPDQFGGWSINITTDDSSPLGDSSSYVHTITDALALSIKETTMQPTDKLIICNLANIIVTGKNTIIVKL